MSPSGDLTKHNIEDDCDDDLDEHHDDSSDKYLENLSDSSSEDEDEDEDIGETNKLKEYPHIMMIELHVYFKILIVFQDFIYFFIYFFIHFFLLYTTFPFGNSTFYLYFSFSVLSS